MDLLLELITAALQEAKDSKKECWRDDVEDKAFHSGEINAYNYCIGMINKIALEQ